MKRLNELRKNKKGFTLMEMIVVIVIIGILMAVLVPGITRWIDNAKETQIEAKARNLYTAVQGEIYIQMKNQDIAAAINAAKQEVDGDEFIVAAGSTKANFTWDNNNITVDPKTGNITMFVYKEGQKKATYKDGAWKIE